MPVSSDRTVELAESERRSSQSSRSGRRSRASLIITRHLTVGIFNSGTRLSGAGGANPPDPAASKRLLDGVHTPTLYITGDADLDIAFTGGQDSFSYLTKVPVAQKVITHADDAGIAAIRSIDSAYNRHFMMMSR